MRQRMWPPPLAERSSRSRTVNDPGWSPQLARGRTTERLPASYGESRCPAHETKVLE